MIDRAHDVPKLLDMGLVKKTDASRASRLTQSGMAIGTPHYISPEQARGEEAVDSRSDIYALGATLYHMLTGRVPFEGNTAAVIMTKHLTEQLTWPSDVTSSVSEHASLVVSKMMAKDPDNRYPTPQAVVEDIDLILAGKEPSVKAQPPVPSSIGRAMEHERPAHIRILEFVAERRVLAVSIGLASVVLLTAFVALATRWYVAASAAPPMIAESVNTEIEVVAAFERRLEEVDPRRIPEILSRARSADLTSGLNNAERARMEAAFTRARERYERAAASELSAIMGEDEAEQDLDAELLTKLRALREDYGSSLIVPKLDAMIAELAQAEELREAAYAEFDLLSGLPEDDWRVYGDWSFGEGGAVFRYDSARRYSNAVQSNVGFGEGTFALRLTAHGGARATVSAWDQGTQDVQAGETPSGWIAELPGGGSTTLDLRFKKTSDGVSATLGGETIPVRARNEKVSLGNGRLTVAPVGGEWRIERLAFTPASPAGALLHRASLHVGWRGPARQAGGNAVSVGTDGAGQAFRLTRSARMFVVLRTERAERLSIRIRIDGEVYRLRLSGQPIAGRWQALALPVEDFRAEEGGLPPETGEATEIEITASGQEAALELRSVEFNARSH